MRNIRLFVEFASVIMPGAVLLLVMILIFAPSEFLASGVLNSATGIMGGLAMSFATGHLLQGFAQLVIEPLSIRITGGWAADWAILRFVGRESRRYLTVEQLEQLELQYPAKLSIPFPKPADASNRAVLDAAISHAEAFLYSAKANEHLDDIIADYKLNKGLFTAFALVFLGLLFSLLGWVPANTGSWTWPAIAASFFAAVCSFVRMEYHSRKYAQSLFLQFLATPGIREGSGRGNDGGGGGGLPIGGLGRGAGARHQPVAQDDDAA